MGGASEGNAQRRPLLPHSWGRLGGASEGSAQRRPLLPHSWGRLGGGAARRPAEPLTAVHPAPHRHHAADDCGAGSRVRGLQAAAASRAARGGLPHHPGHHALPRRQPGRDGIFGHRPAGTTVRPDAGAGADVVGEFRRRVGHHPALRSVAVAFRSRAGSAGRHQRREQSAAFRPAAAADLRQGQPGRRPRHHPRPDLSHAAAHHPVRPGRYAPEPEALAGVGRGPGHALGRT